MSIIDAADPAAWARAKEQVEQAFGPVRILCNNAGVFAAGGPVENIDPQTWRWLFGIKDVYKRQICCGRCNSRNATTRRISMGI